MDFSHAGAAPSIRVYDSNPHVDRYVIPRRASYVSSRSSATSSPMSIPNAAGRAASPPPPLPPPRHIEVTNGHDLGWQFGNSACDRNQPSEVKPGSSLLGHRVKRSEKSIKEEEQNGVDFARRGSSTSTIKVEHDSAMPMSEGEGSASLGGLDYSTSLRSDYDQQQLSRIGRPNTSRRSAKPLSLSTGSQEAPLSQSPITTERRQTGSDATISRWSSISSSGPTSPESRRARRLGSASTVGTADETASHRGSYDHGVFLDHDFHMDDSGMKDLNINDRSPSLTEDLAMAPKAGQKRRADSPQREPSREERPSTSSNSGGSDLFHRRSMQQLQFATRGSPGTRHQGSVSSASSFGLRNGSFASSHGLSGASSATSYNSERLDRFSPGALSPLADPDVAPTSPYASSRSLNPSPGASLSTTQQQLVMSEAALTQRSGAPGSDGQSHSRQSSVGKMSGMFICECCPKKPKKFETAEELRLHTMEKQYTCAYCPNRFKNKNEAERHQNSLHLRKHSWSCNALAGPEAAFTHSTNTASAADVCGYCGEEFPTPPDWAVRTDHLNRVHKYLECNQSKKFYRADHFRQHLKHSHAGTSGKWTNMLENACMRDEPPPKERISSVSSVSSSAAGPSTAGSSGGAFMAPPATMTVPGAPKHEIINESHEES
ncbi:MAG: hypothetical protein M1821_005928 [Bathelium mastoideum]|nr:MAG: hypothetical protein M1821_005928 [Bathelium mastoideum]KAI9688532.1 MAG: hypothetical protein M1822_001481 [Bathelium mastoideum]